MHVQFAFAYVQLAEKPLQSFEKLHRETNAIDIDKHVLALFSHLQLLSWTQSAEGSMPDIVRLLKNL